MWRRKNMAIHITTCICGEERTWPYTQLLVYVEKRGMAIHINTCICGEERTWPYT